MGGSGHPGCAEGVPSAGWLGRWQCGSSKGGSEASRQGAGVGVGNSRLQVPHPEDERPHRGSQEPVTLSLPIQRQEGS